MERRYHVGRVDGSGKIYRVESRAEAEKIKLEMGATEGHPPGDYYVDGPPEPTEADRVSDVIRNFIRESKQTNGNLIERLVNAETDEERDRIIRQLPDDLREQNQFIQAFSRTFSGQGIGRAFELALKMGAPMDLVASIGVDLGYRAGRAMAEQEQLAKMVR